MNVRAIKTDAAQSAVDSIKNMNSKKFDYGVSFKTPQEFIDKRHYMQSDEFLKDTHNVIMFNLVDDMMTYRARIRDQINSMNKHLQTKLVQAINGFTRVSAELEKDYDLNFDDTPTVQTDVENQYRILRNVLLWTQTRNLK